MNKCLAIRLWAAAGLCLFILTSPARADFFRYTFNYGTATVTDSISGNIHTYNPGSFSVDSLALMSNGQTSTLDIAGNWNGFTPGEVLALGSPGQAPDQFEGVQSGCETTPTCGPAFTVTQFEVRTTLPVTGPGTYSELAGVATDFCYQTSDPSVDACALANSVSLDVVQLPGSPPGVPEPASPPLLGTALASLGLSGWRHRQSQH